jgi:hypothetical protein
LVGGDGVWAKVSIYASAAGEVDYHFHKNIASKMQFVLCFVVQPLDAVDKERLQTAKLYFYGKKPERSSLCWG